MNARFALLLLAFLGLPAFAHKASDAYLTIEQHADAADVRLDVALRDLDAAIGLDADGDGAITWRELRASHEAIAQYVMTRLSLSAGGQACALRAVDHRVDRHTDGAYAVVRLAARCAEAPALAIDYRLMFDTDATHRGLVRYVAAGGATKSIVLSADAPHASLAVHTGVVEQARAYVLQGAHHIAEGADHLLFLVSLLLPAVVVRRGRQWAPVASFRDAFVDAAKIVTAFTLAHSITLTLAVLDVVTLPSRLVESAIALSVVLAALNNLRPVVRNARVGAAFAFGLVHGFGFAGALGELGLPDDALVLSLASFNVGVELAQLALVAAFLPVAFALRATAAYRRIALSGGSAAIVAVGALWFVERTFDVPLALAFAAR